MADGRGVSRGAAGAASGSGVADCGGAGGRAVRGGKGWPRESGRLVQHPRVGRDPTGWHRVDNGAC